MWRARNGLPQLSTHPSCPLPRVGFAGLCASSTTGVLDSTPPQSFPLPLLIPTQTERGPPTPGAPSPRSLFTDGPLVFQTPVPPARGNPRPWASSARCPHCPGFVRPTSGISGHALLTPFQPPHSRLSRPPEGTPQLNRPQEESGHERKGSS